MNKAKTEFTKHLELHHQLLTLPRGKERRESHFQIVLATLRFLSPEYPTRDQLQKASRIRRKRFIQVLKYLLNTGTVVKFGAGEKRNPFLFKLSDEHLNA